VSNIVGSSYFFRKQKTAMDSQSSIRKGNNSVTLRWRLGQQKPRPENRTGFE